MLHHRFPAQNWNTMSVLVDSIPLFRLLILCPYRHKMNKSPIKSKSQKSQMQMATDVLILQMWNIY